jgi:hypothetical protein
MGHGGGIIKRNSIVALLCASALVLCILPSAESLNYQNTILSSPNMVSTGQTSVSHAKTVKAATTVKRTIKGYGVKVTTKTVTATARCSCGALGNYNFHKGIFLNYCPICHKYGVLKWNPKAVAEGEWTCKCGADYCAACGKIKIKGNKKHLTKA